VRESIARFAGSEEEEKEEERGIGGLCPHGLAPEAITKRPLRGLEKKKKKTKK
jgi:hypothetical protein